MANCRGKSKRQIGAHKLNSDCNSLCDIVWKIIFVWIKWRRLLVCFTKVKIIKANKDVYIE